MLLSAQELFCIFEAESFSDYTLQSKAVLSALLSVAESKAERTALLSVAESKAFLISVDKRNG